MAYQLFGGYFVSKIFFKNSKGKIEPTAGRIKGFIPFLNFKIRNPVDIANASLHAYTC